MCWCHSQAGFPLSDKENLHSSRLTHALFCNSRNNEATVDWWLWQKTQSKILFGLDWVYANIYAGKTLKAECITKRIEKKRLTGKTVDISKNAQIYYPWTMPPFLVDDILLFWLYIWEWTAWAIDAWQSYPAWRRGKDWVAVLSGLCTGWQLPYHSLDISIISANTSISYMHICYIC